MSIWQFELLGGLNFCQFEVPSPVLFVSNSYHWGFFGKGWGPVWSTYLKHPDLQIYIFLLPRRYHSSRSLCQQLTLVVLSFPVFCGNWHRFCSKWRSGSLMTFPLFLQVTQEFLLQGRRNQRFMGGEIAHLPQTLAWIRSKTFSFKKPHITWIFRPSYGHAL